MTNAKEATMRRIAIVLASLPDSVAKKLLGSLQGDSQRLVRTALGSLTDVDPLERRRALDGFANSLRHDKAPASKSSDAAEIVFSRTAIRNLNERVENVPPLNSTNETVSPLAFLLDVDDETLVTHLAREMPQTLAIILASISPAQAARVLPRLDVNLRTEAMRRISNLREIPSELIDDIGNQLRSRLMPIGGKSDTGKRALDAILAEMPTQNHQPQTRVNILPQNEVLTFNMEPLADRETEHLPAIKIAEGTGRDHQQDSKLKTEYHHSSPLASTDSIHQYLINLPVDRLRESLGCVEVQQALLTLCGLPNATAEAVLSSLPRKQAKQVRDQLGELVTLELRDIDQAKEAVARQAFTSKTVTKPSRMSAAA